MPTIKAPQVLPDDVYNRTLRQNVHPDDWGNPEPKGRYNLAVIATGAHADAPSISGFAETGYLTSETVFSLTELPSRLAVVGAGPIGCELSQTFARFGSEVFLLEAGHEVLPREDRDAAQRVEESFRRDGVQFLVGCKIVRAKKLNGHKVVQLKHEGNLKELAVDEVLVEVGRAPTESSAQRSWPSMPAT